MLWAFHKRLFIKYNLINVNSCDECDWQWTGQFLHREGAIPGIVACEWGFEFSHLVHGNRQKNGMLYGGNRKWCDVAGMYWSMLVKFQFPRSDGVGVGEMAQQSRVHASLTEDPAPIAGSTAHNYLLHSSSRRSGVLFWPLKALEHA